MALTRVSQRRLADLERRAALIRPPKDRMPWLRSCNADELDMLERIVLDADEGRPLSEADLLLAGDIEASARQRMLTDPPISPTRP